jgi:hypothetical protein
MMSNGATLTSDPPRRTWPGTEGKSLLARLETAHCDLLAELRAMDVITAKATPDVGRYTSARWRLTKASRSRRAVIEDAIKQLRNRASTADMLILERLRAEDIQAVRRSSEHIYRWTNEAVMRDWAGYCQASQLIRKSMRARIGLEQQTLFPILLRY